MRRRDFFKVTAALSGGLLISWKSSAETRDVAAVQSIHDLLHIGTDSRVEVILSKVEMGQGIWTTLPMLVAEELDCDWNKITAIHRPSGKGKDFEQSLYVLSTGGSDSTRSEFERYRMAGAVVRNMLVNAAAKKWNVAAETCKTENGYVIAGNQSASYGELVADAVLLPATTVPLRDASTWKIIGRSKERLDLSDKVNGQAMYGIDVQFPGLLTAVVAHPPAFGAKIKSWDATKTNAIKGVVSVVQIPEGIAVLAENFWSAKLGREALDIQWDLSAGEGISSARLKSDYRELIHSKGLVSQEKGNVDSSLSGPAHTFEFTFPYLAHAPMETLNCTVRLNEVGGEIWTGTQSPIPNQLAAANYLGCRPEEVIFHTPFLGGSFGRRGSFDSDWVMEAVHIAKASGKAVKLIWTREDDIKGGYYRPLYYHHATIALNSNGTPHSWHHHVAGQSLFENTVLAKDIVVDGIDYSSIGGVHGSAYFSSIPHHRIELHTTHVDVPVLPLRSVSHTHTAFVMETIVDELAVLAKKDPVEYRRELLKDHTRLLGVLNTAAEQCSWNTPADGKFRGVAVHAAMNSYVCHVVELTMEGSTPRLHRVVCAIDCGIAVNPDGIRAQMESGIIYGLTAALYGEISIDQGRVKQSNFNDYKMLRMKECPQIDVHIVGGSSDVGGVGEPGVPPIAPALGNALFAATGKRMRHLPFSLGAA